MTREEFDTLRLPEVQAALAAAAGRDPLAVALDARVPHARLVATQLKYRERARHKLPAFAAAGAIFPPRAFEQASGEACALLKRPQGETVLDLTCGLGVDAWALSRRFGRVTTLERDPVLAEVAAWNFRRLGCTNIEVVCASAEEYLQREGLRFDWIYADPDRRDGAGRRRIRLGDCSPDMEALLPAVRRVAGGLCVKCSPMFDVAEAFRIFGRCRVEAVSWRDECKEVLVCADGSEPQIAAVAIGADGSETRFSAPWPVEEPAAPPAFDPAAYRWLVQPDVALRKSRTTRRHLAGRADCWSNDGYGFAAEPPTGVMGRIMEIDRIEPYDPRTLKRSLRQELPDGRAEILKRDFPLATAEIARRIGVTEGGSRRIAFTKIGGKLWTIRLK